MSLFFLLEFEIGDSGGPLMVRKNSTAAAQIYTQVIKCQKELLGIA
jgi:hypothetical protein